MPHFYDIQYRDFSDELSTVQFPIGPITVVTIVAELVELAALRAAVAGITLGVQAADTIIMDKTIISAARPASENAQRERKWLVNYHGNTSNTKGTLTIPTAALIGRIIPGTDLADLTEASMATFVTAFNATVLKQYAAGVGGVETVTLDKVTAVGRNT